MEIKLTIPDKLIEKIFESGVDEKKIAEWVKGKIAFDLFYGELTGKKNKITKQKR